MKNQYKYLLISTQETNLFITEFFLLLSAFIFEPGLLVFNMGAAGCRFCFFEVNTINKNVAANNAAAIKTGIFLK